MKTKVCLKCGEEKDINLFAVRVRRGVYLAFDFCRTCRPQQKSGVRRWRQMVKELKSAATLASRAIKANASIIEMFSKRQIIDRDGAKCYICGRRLTYKTATVDHLIPLARGGVHTSANARIACQKCNNEKGDSIPLFYFDCLIFNQVFSRPFRNISQQFPRADQFDFG